MKRYRFSVLATVCMSILFALMGCQDDEFSFTPGQGNQLISNTRSTAMPSALIKESDGNWRATKCVPLVGEGRIVDDFSDGLIKALGESGGGFDPLLDTNLTNTAGFGGSLVSAEVLGNQLVSVRDLDRTYAGGQVAGFVYKMADPSLLTLDLLKTFWLATYHKGQLQETHNGSSEGGALGLNLLNIASNNDNQGVTVSAYFEKPFDEIKIGIGGIDADLLKNFKIYYAFVGENETKYCTKGSLYFPDSKVHYNGFLDLGWTSFLPITAEEVVDKDLTNGAGMALIKAGKITIDTGKEIPAGSEIGFVITGGSLLELGIGSTTQLTTYDKNDQKVEEITIAKVLGLSAIGGGKTAVSMITTKPCQQVRLNISGITVDLGASIINYAYVKDPVEVDPTSYFSLSNVTITGNTYYLSSPAGGKTTWVILDSPNGATPVIKDNKITGMTVDGEYIIGGTFTNAEGYSVTQQMVIIRDTKKQENGCNQMIGPEYGAQAEKPLGSSGALIELDGFQNAVNLVDGDWNNYAKYIGGISLANKTGIVAITTTQPVNPNKNKIKTGFVMHTANEFLGAGLLEFFVIKLYNNGTLVAEQAIDGNGVADVGLIGNQGNKIRVGFTTQKTFDRIELWTMGALNLKLQEYRLYGAYWEDANSDCISADPSEACIEMLTPASHGASINYLESKVGGGAELTVSYNNLGNLLDADMNTSAYISGALKLATATTVAVKFNKIYDPNKNTKIGFILKRPTGVLDLGLLKGTVLKLYHNNVPVGDKVEGEVLDVDLIGYTGRAFVETTARTTEFDEVRITFGEGLSLLDGDMELSGVFIRRDSDNDGIPDCAEDEENKDITGISNATPESEHVCLRGYPNIIINVTGGVENKNYTLQFYDLQSGSKIEKNCTLENGKFIVATQDMPSGDYYIGIYKDTDIQYNGVHVILHPEQTEWKTDARSTKWDDWSNWSNGTPWTCTDVVIPSNCRVYPVLENNENHCRYIHFCPGAEVVNTHYLTYRKAWVDLSLTGGRYYMLSAPLKAMVTGDMFIPNKLNGNHGTLNYFEELNKGTAIESRLTPTVYQRLWSSEAKGHTIQGEVTVTPDATLWTPPFNDLAQTYEPGMGFSLKAGTAPRTYTFRFPKTHTEYHYVYGDGSNAGQPTEVISRNENIGRFIYENSNGKGTLPYTVTVKNQTPGTTFIAGNPFMAHIDIKEFMKKNPNITSVKVYDGNSNNTLILANGELLGTDGSLAYLAPMQAFFVTTTQAASTLDLTYEQNMLVQQPDVRLYTHQHDIPFSRAALHTVKSHNDKGTLHISAYSQKASSSCLISIRSNATDAYQSGEDSRILLDNEILPVIAVFSEADGQALDIQQMNHRTEIPLGFSMKSEGEVILKLNHANDKEWNNWMLLDKQTKKRWSLKDGYIQAELGMLSSNVGRFCLIKSDNL